MLLLAMLLLGVGGGPVLSSTGVAAPIYRSLPATKTPGRRDVMNIPSYRDGKVTTLRVGGRFAYLIEPRAKVDPARRWVWVFPFEHALESASGGVEMRFYVDQLLAAGFAVAGIDVGVSCGSPRGAERCEEFYKMLVERHGLNPRARLLAQSNGGLIAYAWAFRHPRSVDRIAGIYPAVDLRSWPKVPNLVAYPAKGLGFDLTADRLATRLAEFNPVDNLAPLVQAHVKVFLIHGDHDKTVPLAANSAELVRRYTKLGGSAELVVVKGLGHGGAPFSHSRRLAAFLLGD